MKKKLEEQLLDNIRKNPENWKGVFYVNRKDPRIFVPKLNPRMGWTLNFGNMWAIVGLTLIVAIIVGWSIWI